MYDYQYQDSASKEDNNHQKEEDNNNNHEEEIQENLIEVEAPEEPSYEDVEYHEYEYPQVLFDLPHMALIYVERVVALRNNDKLNSFVHLCFRKWNQVNLKVPEDR